MKRLIVVAGVALLSAIGARAVLAHCEIPCGIYGDKMRFDMIMEHVATIEKAMQEIAKLSAEGDKNYNQLVRWIGNKEDHAGYVQDIVSQYFLTQRIKSPDPAKKDEAEKYGKHLKLLHEMLVAAMKCKQTIDPAEVGKLKSLTSEFRASYLGPEGEAHTH